MSFDSESEDLDDLEDKLSDIELDDEPKLTKLEKLEERMKLLQWHKLANDAALKAALIRNRKCYKRKQRMKITKPNSVRVTQKKRLSVFERYKPLVIDENEDEINQISNVKPIIKTPRKIREFRRKQQKLRRQNKANKERYKSRMKKIKRTQLKNDYKTYKAPKKPSKLAQKRLDDQYEQNYRKFRNLRALTPREKSIKAATSVAEILKLQNGLLKNDDEFNELFSEVNDDDEKPLPKIYSKMKDLYG